MTKRNAMIAALSAMVGMMSGGAKASDDGGSIGNVWNNGPQRLTFNLDSFKDFTFKQGKDTITLTPAEVMAALMKD